MATAVVAAAQALRSAFPAAVCPFHKILSSATPLRRSQSSGQASSRLPAPASGTLSHPATRSLWASASPCRSCRSSQDAVQSHAIGYDIRCDATRRRRRRRSRERRSSRRSRTPERADKRAQRAAEERLVEEETARRIEETIRKRVEAAMASEGVQKQLEARLKEARAKLQAAARRPLARPLAALCPPAARPRSTLCPPSVRACAVRPYVRSHARPSAYHPAPSALRSASGLLPVGLQSASSQPPVCFQSASSLLPVCLQSASGQPAVCFRSASGRRPVGLQSACRQRPRRGPPPRPQVDAVIAGEREQVLAAAREREAAAQREQHDAEAVLRENARKARLALLRPTALWSALCGASATKGGGVRSGRALC